MEWPCPCQLCCWVHWWVFAKKEVSESPNLSTVGTLILLSTNGAIFAGGGISIYSSRTSVSWVGTANRWKAELHWFYKATPWCNCAGCCHSKSSINSTKRTCLLSVFIHKWQRTSSHLCQRHSGVLTWNLSSVTTRLFPITYILALFQCHNFIESK